MQGRTFKVPEKVPFRLTPQMVDGLGVAGYEGACAGALDPATTHAL
jgi:phosphatidylinositol kinase/protein kinase (PI-3  family)